MLLKPLPANPYQRPEVPEGMPKVSHLCLVVGSPGQGKTYVTCQLIRAYMDAGVYNRIYCISPTYHTNAYGLEHAGVKPEDAFTGLHQAVDALQEVLDRIKADHSAFKANREHWDAWSNHRAGKQLSTRERMLLENLGRPVVRLDPPRPALICDDVQATKLCSSRLFQSTAVRRRHIRHDPQVELSIYVLSQSLKSGALPRSMRGMADLCIVFPTRDRSILKDLYEELSSKCTWEQFQQVFAYATTGGDRPYLVVDQTQGLGQTFRRKLDGEWLDPDKVPTVSPP